MAKYRARSLVEIDAEQFWPERHPWPLHVVIDGEQQWAVWNALHGSRIKLKPGDGVNVSDPGDVYPSDRAICEARYERVG